MSLKPMIRGTYAGEPDNFKRCLELGFTFFQTDSDHLSTNETALEASTAEKMRSWVEAGGVFLYTGRIESVEGTILFENKGPEHCGKGLLYGVNASAEDETLALLRRWFHVEPPCGKALIPAVCADIGGVCGVVLESGRAFLYNGTDVPARKAVDGTLHTVEPHTIVQVR